jgi:hypothetical protein
MVGRVAKKSKVSLHIAAFFVTIITKKTRTCPPKHQRRRIDTDSYGRDKAQKVNWFLFLQLLSFLCIFVAI